MKLLQLSKILIFSVLLGAVFTSCDSEYYDRYKTSNLNIITEGKTNSYGEFRSEFDVYIEELTNVNFNYERISDLRLISSQLYIDVDEFRAMDKGSVSIYMETYGSDFSVTAQILSDRPGAPAYAYIDERDSNYARFIENMLYELERKGVVRLYMEGDFRDAAGRRVSNMWYKISIGNLLEVETY